LCDLPLGDACHSARLGLAIVGPHGTCARVLAADMHFLNPLSLIFLSFHQKIFFEILDIFPEKYLEYRALNSVSPPSEVLDTACGRNPLLVG
jgi:hypothetical protein